VHLVRSGCGWTCPQHRQRVNLKSKKPVKEKKKGSEKKKKAKKKGKKKQDSDDTMPLFSRTDGNGTWKNKHGYVALCRENGVHLGELELLALAELVRAPVSLLKSGQNTLDPDEAVTYRDDLGKTTTRSSKVRPTLGIYLDEEKGHYQRALPPDADEMEQEVILVDVRGQGNCLLLVAATYTKPELLRAKRVNGVLADEQLRGVEDAEGARLRRDLCDIMESNPQIWNKIEPSGSLRYKPN
jgi:hypothetical protein